MKNYIKTSYTPLNVAHNITRRNIARIPFETRVSLITNNTKTQPRKNYKAINLTNEHERKNTQ